MEELKTIIQHLNNFRELTQVKYDDNTILECATRIFNTQKMNGHAKPEGKMASDKQKEFLKKHTSVTPDKIDEITKIEASQIIKEVMEKWSN